MIYRQISSIVKRLKTIKSNSRDVLLLNSFLALLKPYSKYLIIASLCMIGFSVFTAFTAYLIKPAMDSVFVHKDLSTLKIMPFVVLMVFFIKGIFQWGGDYFLQRAGLNIVSDLRAKLFDHIINMPLSYHDNQSGGTLISRLTSDVYEIQEALSKAVAALVRDIFTIIGLTFIIFYQNWRLALIATLVLPIAFCPLFIFGRILRKLSHKSQQSLAYLTNVLHEAFRGVRIIKTFCQEARENEKFKHYNQKFFHYTERVAWFDAMASPLMEFIGAIGIASIMGYGGYQVIMGKDTPGSFFSFLGGIIMLYRPIKALSRINNFVQKGMASLDRVHQILDLSREQDCQTNYTTVGPLGGKISFKNVSFSYNGSDKVLKNLTFDINHGEIIALVGPSGSGKTTLVSLIPRFYDPMEGSILIGGRDIASISLKSLRENIAIVTQNNFLFNDTIRNNIAYGKKDATDEEIIQASKLAFAHDFITRFPDGFDTVVGEQGVKLSGGEQQRICIARAILKNAPILIMDEATSSLDSESELEVQKALSNLMAGRTTFIIAHRLSTIKKAQRIFVMSEGHIVEEGSHEKLISLGGLYTKLYELQYGKDLPLMVASG